MIALRVVQGVTKHFPARWPEWVFSATLFSLGCRLLGGSDTFNSSASYRVMAQIATEDSWGLVICFIAGARLIALGLNGTFRFFARLSPIIRSTFGVLSGFVWFSIALGFYLSNPEGWGYLTYTGWLVGDIINAILAGGDAGASERRYRNGCTR